MAKFTNPLANVRVASPCPANWDEMAGDNQKRFCGQCKLNVYNLSGMTRDEAENLLLNAEGRLCVRFYRRADGSVLTEDCPVGWRALKQKVSRTVAAAFSFAIGLFGGVGFSAAFDYRSLPITGQTISPSVEITKQIEELKIDETILIKEPEETVGILSVEPIIGKMISPPNKLQKKPLKSKR